jgi:branched-chain amino acid transport system permease protein
MDSVLRQALSGAALGAVYAIVALAVVMVYKATRHVNFAIGEMAMFSAFVAAACMDAGLSYWWALAVTLIMAFATGALIERLLVERLEQASSLSVLVVMIGLLLVFNSLAGWLFGFTIRTFPSPFPARSPGAGAYLSGHEAGIIGLSLVVVLALYLLFEHTKTGLALRATADNRVSSRLVGIRAGWMLAIGWGVASAIAAVAAVMIAPLVYLEPNTMTPVLIYGFAAALLGGIESPPGAILGGFVVGILENLAGAFVVGPELKLIVALVIIIGVLIMKPSGFLGPPRVARV